MNNQIAIPFRPQFKQDMRDGKKTFTTRTKRYGYPGDWFIAFGMYFVLTRVGKTHLKIVAECHYHQEGFESPRGFIEIWEELHPKMGYQPHRDVFLHEFERARDVLKFHIHEFNDSPTCCICGFQRCAPTEYLGGESE